MGKKVKVTTMANVRDGEYGLTVKVKNDSPYEFTKAMRKFKRKVADSGVLQELREREYYQKPSEKRREAKKRGIARVKREQRIANEDFSPAYQRKKR